jgi:hypothetical protein
VAGGGGPRRGDLAAGGGWLIAVGLAGFLGLAVVVEVVVLELVGFDQPSETRLFEKGVRPLARRACDLGYGPCVLLHILGGEDYAAPPEYPKTGVAEHRGRRS